MGEKASTGLHGLDKVMEFLRLGDNVVWQVDSTDDYRHFVEPFVRQGLQEGRKIVYIRFGNHEALLESSPLITVYHLEAGEGFEAFSTEVHRIATEEGQEVYYVFDCLSDLLFSWATDLMIGNFFRVTCPYLFELNTIAYFCILRTRNSYDTIARIRETTQLFLDVYREDRRLFVHPIKVWNRYTPTMFLPHMESAEEQYLPITSSTEASRLFSRLSGYGPGNVERKLDFWDHVFLRAREMVSREPGDAQLEAEKRDMLEQVARMVLGRDGRILELALQYFSLEDMLEIRNRLIGTGYIGGKTVGMLLARKILEKRSGQWSDWLEPHDSFFIGSDLYYTYLVENGCWNLRVEQKKIDNYFALADALRERIESGKFPDFIRGQFAQMLDYFGQAPIIVRSSSLLEDGFGNAFAGKYESEFCVNRGSPQERYEVFEKALRTVYASTMSHDALAYRLQRGMADKDEQMAVLVQRVSGAYHSQYFFPDMAGVAMSNNPYVWKEDLDPEAGMVRLVLGLGTRAVDRVDEDYPRIISLDQPLLKIDSSPEGIKQYSQHRVDVLDTRENTWKTIDLRNIPLLDPALSCWEQVASRDWEATRKLKQIGIDEDYWVLTWDKFLQNAPLVKRLKNMVDILEEAYAYPVDTEFTANISEKAGLQVNLLQCRPLQTWKRRPEQQRREMRSNRETVFSTPRRFMGFDNGVPIQKIVHVRVDSYANLTGKEKYQVARMIGQLNSLLKARNSNFMIIGPGRWGTSIPSLGVPVSFSEICHAAVMVEVADQEHGFMPEMSFGTHFFQDLVETEILYVALFPAENGVIFQEELLTGRPNRLRDYLPEGEKYQHVVSVVDLTPEQQALFMDVDFDSHTLEAAIVPLDLMEQR